ncbi:hypothetical protein OS493_029620 [Desmophyllum pertusum]|uniref:CUB domain-containing protein n=1 Tax=Desmophyllum pertusum TaxID=174260 RepID=A0A9W9ZYC2_9CNID|nr:hypothetical protein OS493_029620 [Desmophyllum pertusum]
MSYYSYKTITHFAFADVFNLLWVFVLSETRCSRNKSESLNNNIYLTKSSDTFSSPEYDTHGTYPANMSCVWIISLPRNKIKLSFSEFDLQDASPSCQNGDFVEVRDGEHSNSPILGTFCGSTIPSDTISSGSHMLVQFRSDDSAEKRGFTTSYATYNATNAAFILRNNSVKTVNVDQELCRPRQPKYTALTMMAVFIELMKKPIELEFEFFDFGNSPSCSTKQDASFVEVRDGVHRDSQQLGLFCGHASPEKISSIGNDMWVRFKANRYRSVKFKATYRAVKGWGSCSTAQSFVWSLPGAKAPVGIAIGFSETHTTTEDSPPIVLVIAGVSTIVGLMMILLLLTLYLKRKRRNSDEENTSLADCQNQENEQSRPGATTATSGEHIDLQFCPVADMRKQSLSEQELDTSCIIVLLQPTETATPRTSCSRNIRNVTFNGNGKFMIFHSPLYPSTVYPLSINCTYLFKAPEGHRIELVFSTFHLEGASPRCNNDYIVVRDGPSENSPLINKFCGAQDLKPIISSTNSIHMYFVSNDIYAFDGFNGTYRVISEVDIAKCTIAKTTAHLFSRDTLQALPSLQSIHVTDNAHGPSRHLLATS